MMTSMITTRTRSMQAVRAKGPSTDCWTELRTNELAVLSAVLAAKDRYPDRPEVGSRLARIIWTRYCGEVARRSCSPRWLRRLVRDVCAAINQIPAIGASVYCRAACVGNVDPILSAHRQQA